ncbi:outer membrane beta-barrel family protein [Sphingobacterium multivorum]|uniref:outer membrane beta-barrel family protein n=1 Tax=Sphingobacterium multivorum TaxID=28454 RepID=UPI003DA28D49
MKENKIFIVIILVLCSLTVSAQNSSIIGLVKDTNGKLLNSVTVALRNPSDSILIAGAVTDDSGNFTLDRINKGEYKIMISHIGFKTYSNIISVNKSQVLLGDIFLEKDSSIKIDSVIVNRKKPLLTRSLDKLILNVEGSIYEKGENGLRLFNVIPGVRVDGNNIVFRGSEAVTVYIDNRRILLPADQLNTYLSNIPSETIKSYELKVVPGSEIDAQSAGVVINIVLKNEYKYGLSGNVRGGYWFNDNHNANGSTLLNYRVNKLTLQAGLSYRNSPAFYKETYVQNFKKTGVNNNQSLSWEEKLNTIGFNFGADYKISENQTLGLNYNLFKNPGDFSNVTDTKSDFYTISNTSLDSSTISRKNTDYKYKSELANVFYRIKLDSLGGRLDLGYSFVRYNQDEPSAIESKFLNNEMKEFRKRDSLYTHNNGQSKAQVVNIDLEKRLSKNSLLTAGSKYTWSNTDYLMDYRIGLSEESPKDELRSDGFIYNEKILAFYGALNQSLKDWKIKLGLRAERTEYDGHSLVTEHSIARNRWDLFPSLFVSRQIGKVNSITLSYSRRINRPGFRQLNPFTFYTGQNLIQEGNPNLLPYFSHNAQLEYVLKNRYSFTFGYQKTSDGIATKISNQGDIIISRSENISNNSNVFLTSYVPIKLTNWWDFNINVTLRNTNIDVYSDPEIHRSKFSQSLWAVNRISLPNKYYLEVGGFYNRNNFSGIYDEIAVGKIDVAVQKSFFKDKLNARVELMDPFFLHKTGFIIDNEQLYRKSIRNRIDYARSAGIFLTYNFSSGKKQTNRENVDIGGNETRGRL